MVLQWDSTSPMIRKVPESISIDVRDHALYEAPSELRMENSQ